MDFLLLTATLLDPSCLNDSRSRRSGGPAFRKSHFNREGGTGNGEEAVDQPRDRE